MDNVEMTALPPDKEALLKASPVLIREKHAQMLLNLEEYARDANIDPKWVALSAKDYTPPKVLEWLTSFGQHSKSLLFVNKSSQVSMQDMCCAIAGVLLRNFISVRVTTVTQFIGMSEAGTENKYTCLIMPAFHSVASGQTISTWNQGYVSDGLVSRQAAGKKTLLVCDDLNAMYLAYGPTVRKMVEEDFVKVTV